MLLCRLCTYSKIPKKQLSLSDQAAFPKSSPLRKKVHIYHHPNRLYTGATNGPALPQKAAPLLEVKIDEGYTSQTEHLPNGQTACGGLHSRRQASHKTLSRITCLNLQITKSTKEKATSSQRTVSGSTEQFTLPSDGSPTPTTGSTRLSDISPPITWSQAQKNNTAVSVECEAPRILYELPLDEPWELPNDCIRVGHKLGQGAFGVVFYGRLDLSRLKNRQKERFVLDGPNTGGQRGSCEVAIKVLRSDFSEHDLLDLVREMEVMKMLDPHPHLIQLYGACTQSWPLQVVVEYAPHGNLRDFLRARRPPKTLTEFNRLMKLPHPTLNKLDLLDYGLQVARGMEYLNLRSVVHRDLAARNVLVGEQFVIKIADFGLTRTVSDYYRKTTNGRLPIKWMSPESLFDRTYTTKSDVWSFGVLLWEIFTLGAVPYPSISPECLPTVLNEGHRNDCPKLANEEIYQLMKRCWAMNPEERPDFSMILRQLESLRQTNGVWLTECPLNAYNEDSATDSGQASAESLDQQLKPVAIDEDERNQLHKVLHTRLQGSSSIRGYSFSKCAEECTTTCLPFDHYVEMTDSYLIPRTATALFP